MSETSNSAEVPATDPPSGGTGTADNGATAPTPPSPPPPPANQAATAAALAGGPPATPTTPAPSGSLTGQQDPNKLRDEAIANRRKASRYRQERDEVTQQFAPFQRLHEDDQRAMADLAELMANRDPRAADLLGQMHQQVAGALGAQPAQQYQGWDRESIVADVIEGLKEELVPMLTESSRTAQEQAQFDLEVRVMAREVDAEMARAGIKPDSWQDKSLRAAAKAMIEEPEYEGRGPVDVLRVAMERMNLSSEGAGGAEQSGALTTGVAAPPAGGVDQTAAVFDSPTTLADADAKGASWGEKMRQMRPDLYAER